MERSITAEHLTAHLNDLVALRGAPAVLRSDNGYIESFNSRLRDERLNTNNFYSLLHARVVITD